MSLARTVSTALVALLLVFGAGCSPDTPDTPAGPRPVTAEEAQLLAATRFLNYNAVSRSVGTTIGARGQQVQVTGWVDFTTHTGYATANGAGFAPQLLRWNLGTVAVQPGSPSSTAEPGMPMPTSGWQSRTMDPERSDLDLVLLVISNLGLDRPENPLLLQQGGALWLGTEQVDGHELTQYAAPPTDQAASTSPQTSVDPGASGLRLWIDEVGRLHRADIRVSSGWVTVTFGDGRGTSLPALPTPSATRS